MECSKWWSYHGRFPLWLIHLFSLDVGSVKSVLQKWNLPLTFLLNILNWQTFCLSNLFSNTRNIKPILFIGKQWHNNLTFNRKCVHLILSLLSECFVATVTADCFCQGVKYHKAENSSHASCKERRHEGCHQEIMSLRTRGMTQTLDLFTVASLLA